jgi:hypothetical protein
MTLDKNCRILISKTEKPIAGIYSDSFIASEIILEPIDTIYDGVYIYKYDGNYFVNYNGWKYNIRDINLSSECSYIGSCRIE